MCDIYPHVARPPTHRKTVRVRNVPRWTKRERSYEVWVTESTRCWFLSQRRWRIEMLLTDLRMWRKYILWPALFISKRRRSNWWTFVSSTNPSECRTMPEMMSNEMSKCAASKRSRVNCRRQFFPRTVLHAIVKRGIILGKPTLREFRHKFGSLPKFNGPGKLNRSLISTTVWSFVNTKERCLMFGVTRCYFFLVITSWGGDVVWFSPIVSDTLTNFTHISEDCCEYRIACYVN